MNNNAAERTLRAVVAALTILSADAALSGLPEALEAHRREEYVSAFQQFKVLADQGLAHAQRALGFMYGLGQGTPKDANQFIYWITKSAQQGDAVAQELLGTLYEDVIQAPKDSRKFLESVVALQELGLSAIDVPKDDRKAFYWYDRAAEGGRARAKAKVGSFHLQGRGGVPQSNVQAAYWNRQAADLGDAGAQVVLGLFYKQGTGVVKDEQQAYFWWLLASAQDGTAASLAKMYLRDMEPLLTPVQRASAQAAASKWRPKSVQDSTAGANPVAPDVASRAARPESTGSGFSVSRTQIVTNAHVVVNCSQVSVAGRSVASVQAIDSRSDLALLTVPMNESFASLRAGRLRQGDRVAVIGFPLSGILASGAQITAGNISALAGLQNDSRFIQITAPVQPGNSGGPLVDSSGNIAGVVVSKLDAMKMAQITGDIPQNVNFAVSPLVLQGFLDANGVDYQSAPSNRNLSTSDIAAIGKKYTVLVQCWK